MLCDLKNFFFLWRCDPARVIASSFLRFSRSHTTTHHSRYDSSGRVISSSQRPLPDNTQHSQQTNIHAPYGIRTHDLSRRGAADIRLRTARLPGPAPQTLYFPQYLLNCHKSLRFHCRFASLVPHVRDPLSRWHLGSSFPLSIFLPFISFLGPCHWPRPWVQPENW